LNKEIVVPKRPWTIKVFVGTLFPIMIFGLVFYMFGSEYNSKGFIADIVLLVLLIGIWQGRIWARNLIFIVTLPYTLVFGIASGATILGFGNHENFWQQFYLSLEMLCIPFFLMLIFLKPSRVWFAAMNGNKSEKKLNELSWQFQLLVILVSMMITILTIALDASFNLLSLAKELVLLHDNNPTHLLKIIYSFFFLFLGYFIGTMVVILPFGVILGSWKTKHKLLLWRLSIIGMLFPLITFYFILNKSDHIGFLFIIFIMNLIVSGIVVYGGLILGEKLKLYINTLKMRKKIMDLGA
jgi:MFS family permease